MDKWPLDFLLESHFGNYLNDSESKQERRRSESYHQQGINHATIGAVGMSMVEYSAIKHNGSPTELLYVFC